MIWVWGCMGGVCVYVYFALCEWYGFRVCGCIGSVCVWGSVGVLMVGFCGFYW